MAADVAPVISGRKLVHRGGLLAVLILIGVLLAFRLIGWDRFVANSQLVEGKNNSVYLARAAVACAEKKGALPATSPKVPAELAQVGGKTYASTKQDWTDEAFTCDGFALTEPQRFQYQWERTSELEGIARAQADFNGDGVVEARFEQEVKCTRKEGEAKLICRPGNFYDRNK
jgi:type II secretory pathway pseudopilin PulG